MAGSSIKDVLLAAEQAARSGDIGRAIGLYRAILSKAPKHSKARKALSRLEKQGGGGQAMTQHDANVLLQALNSGNLPMARQTATEMSKAFPNEAFVFNILGYICGQLDDEKAAVAAYKWAIKLNPDFVEALSNYGSYLVHVGRPKEAVDVLRKAVAKKPDYAEAHHNLGIALVALEQTDLALSHYDKAIALNPSYANALNSRGSLYRGMSNIPAALADFEAASELAPNDADILENKSAVLASFGQISQALTITQKLLKLQPDSEDIKKKLGLQLNNLGRNAEALDVFEDILARNPDQADVLFAISRMVTVPEREKIAARMERLIEDDNLSSTDVARLGFGLGGYYESKGDFEKSFTYLKRANDSYKAVLPPPPQTDAETFEQITELFANGPLEGLASAGNPSTRPVFVVGMMRSGTSLVEQILASHKDVFGAGELNTATDLALPLYAQETPVTEAQLSEFAKRYLEMLDLCDGEAERIVDKMPGNFLNIGLLKTAFPNAKFVNLVRDPRDNCFSIYKNFFDTFSHQYAYDQKALAEFANSYKRLMNRWDSLFPDAVYHIKYEDLVTDQEGQSRALLAYLGLPWQDEILEFHKTKRAVRTASVNQVRQKIYKSSVQSWKNYEPFLTPLLVGLDKELWKDAYVD